MRRLSTSLLLVILMCVPLAVCAQVYKWTDAHGTVHFSDSQPPHGVKYTSINVAGDAQPATASVANTAPTTNDAPGNPAPPAPTASQMANTPANRKKLCSTLSANMTLLKGNKPLIMRGTNGKNQLLSAQSRSQELAKAQKQYQAFCQADTAGS